MTPVHTIGINWQSVITIISGVVGLIVLLGGIFGRYLNRNITTAINNQTIVLKATLESKDTVTALANRVVLLEAQMRYQEKKG